jgi:hypothetical protein
MGVWMQCLDDRLQNLKSFASNPRTGKRIAGSNGFRRAAAGSFATDLTAAVLRDSSNRHGPLGKYLLIAAPDLLKRFFHEPVRDHLTADRAFFEGELSLPLSRTGRCPLVCRSILAARAAERSCRTVRPAGMADTSCILVSR